MKDSSYNFIKVILISELGAESNSDITSILL